MARLNFVRPSDRVRDNRRTEARRELSKDLSPIAPGHVAGSAQPKLAKGQRQHPAKHSATAATAGAQKATRAVARSLKKISKQLRKTNGIKISRSKGLSKVSLVDADVTSFGKPAPKDHYRTHLAAPK